MVILHGEGMGLAMYLLVALHGTIHSLIGIILGVASIKIIFRSKSIAVVVLPSAMDQSKCVGSKILSRL
jgi:hypothetical protein